MKCVALKGVKEFEIKEIEEPKKEKGKVMIEITKSGICGSDIHNFEMGNPIGVVMGHEFCGKVIDNGDREDLNIGDRVTALPISPCGHCSACLSGNNQFCLETWNKAIGLSVDNPGGLTHKINVRSDMVIKVPTNITDEEVAMVEPTAVSLHAIHLADIKVGDKVLIIGGGIIGLTAAMFAKKEGASFVAISEVNDKRGNNAIKLGVADKYFKADQDIIKNLLTEVNEGFDVVIECCGNSAAVSTALMAVKPGSTIVLVGVSPTPITIPTVVAVLREITIKGAIAYTKDEFKTCIDLMSNKQIDVLKFLSKTVGFDEVQKSYEELMSGSSELIKILVDPNK